MESHFETEIINHDKQCFQLLFSKGIWFHWQFLSNKLEWKKTNFSLFCVTSESYELSEPVQNANLRTSLLSRLEFYMKKVHFTFYVKRISFCSSKNERRVIWFDSFFSILFKFSIISTENREEQRVPMQLKKKLRFEMAETAIRLNIICLSSINEWRTFSIYEEIKNLLEILNRN